jgi:hypothetical protein
MLNLARFRNSPHLTTEVEVALYTFNSVLMTLVLCVAVPILFWLLSILPSFFSALATGTMRIADHFWLDIHTERTPQIDAAQITRCPMTLHEDGALRSLFVALSAFKGNLVHSRLYADARTSEEIGKWYRRQTGLAEPH